jgi:hypothetical protein
VVFRLVQGHYDATANPSCDALMRHKSERVILPAIARTLLVLLSACGGGSGSDTSAPPPPPPPPVSGPTAEDIANAGLAQVRVLFKADSGALEIDWLDTFPSEAGYRVERQLTPGGEWQTQETLPSTPSTGAAYTWSRIIDQSAAYRVVAQRGDYVVPLVSEQSVTTIPVDLAARALALIVEETDPLHDVVHLSVQGAESAESVEYYVDLESIGTSSTGPSFPVEWDTRTEADGNHLLLAHVIQQPGLRIELRRSVSVDNPNVAVSLFIPDRIGGVFPLIAAASSDAGIVSVEFFVNGTSVGLAEEADNGNGWRLLLDTRPLAGGPATIRAVATDNAGQQAEDSLQVVIDNPPVITLEQPLDGAIVSGTLAVRGSVTDDQPIASVTVFLQQVQILQTQQSTFTTDFSLAGLPGGQYTLTVSVVDSAGGRTMKQVAVVVAPSAAFTYVPLGTFAVGTSLLDTDSGTLLYQSPDGTVRMRHPDSSEVELEDSAEILPLQHVDPRTGLGLWQLRGNRVTTAGWFPSGVAKVSLFDSSGTREEVPYDLNTDTFDTFLRSGLHDSWLVWGNERIHMRNLATQDPPHGPVEGSLLRGHAFVTTAGSEALFFTRETGQQQSSTVIDLFRYLLTDQSVVQVSAGGGRHLRPKTDGSRIAWEKASLSQFIHAPPFELLVAPVSNPTASSVMSTQMMSFELNDGVLAWVERASNALALRVNDSEGTTTLSHTTSTALYSTGNGHVIFGEQGKLYAWSRAQGRRLLLEILPAQVIQRDGVVFLTTGQATVTVYRVAL